MGIPVMKLSFRIGRNLLIALLGVALIGCSGETIVNGGASAEDIAAIRADLADIKGRISSLESELSEANEGITQANETNSGLQGLFLQLPDGSAQFATATPVPIIDYDKFGFVIPFPATVEPVASGIGGGDASEESGTLLASAGGVSLLMTWITTDPPLTPQESVLGAFELVSAATGSNFQVTGAGAEGLEVDSQQASYATFAAYDADGAVDGVAVIGGWICESSARSYALTVTGGDLDAVSGSFFYFADSFRCAK